MGWAKAEIPVVTVFKAHQLAAIDIPAAAFQPQLSGLHNRHQDFLAAGGVHLFPDNPLDLLQHPLRQGQVSVYARRGFPDESGPHQQLMTDYFRLSRHLS